MKRLFATASIAFVLVACADETPPPIMRPTSPQPTYAQQSYPPPAFTSQPPPPPPPAQPAQSSDRFASARQKCLEATNAYRARVGAAPVVGRPDKAACTDTDARGDATQGTVHGGSGQCGFGAQNECPGWPGTADGIVAECLKSMFDEGPGEPYSAHGHYINMTGRDYRGLECGFYETGGKVWLIQNYFR